MSEDLELSEISEKDFLCLADTDELIRRYGNPVIIHSEENVMRKAVIGEDWGAHENPYMNLRPDTQTHGNFDRMLCIAYAACMIPSPMFSDELLRLIQLNREANTTQNYPYEWLDLKLCEALYRCGAPDGGALLREHLHNRYAVMRKYAGKILGCDA